MILTVVVNVVATFADTGASYLITQAVHPGNAYLEMIKSEQYPNLDFSTFSFGGWSMTIRHRGNITEAMEMMINSARNIPDYVPGRTYIPKKSDYKSG
ncbi:hypothetical protein BGX27_001555, partial [Mortierella sp. AM989]